jgi:hypothetical protein
VQDKVFAELDQESLRRTQQLLRDFSPKLLREMNRAIVETAEGVTQSAGIRLRTLQQTMSMDMSKPWPEDAAARYRVRMTSGLVQLLQRTRGGCIVEFAGRANPQGRGSQRGRTLINTLNERYGPTGRLLWHEFDRDAPALMARIDVIVRDAETELNMQLGLD